MKKVFLILFISTFTNIFCQNSDFEKAKSEFEQFIFSSDSTKIQNIKTEKFENIFEINKFNQTVSRDVEFGLRELIFNITFVTVAQLLFFRNSFQKHNISTSLEAILERFVF